LPRHVVEPARCVVQDAEGDEFVAEPLIEEQRIVEEIAGEKVRRHELRHDGEAERKADQPSRCEHEPARTVRDRRRARQRQRPVGDEVFVIVFVRPADGDAREQETGDDQPQQRACTERRKNEGRQ